MVEKTPNHALNLYRTGDEDWTHTPDMETLEERLWVHDIAENRNEYVAYENTAFLATDTSEVYLGNGSEWNQLGKIGDTDYDEIHIKDNTGEVFAREFAGADLAAKVENALDYLTSNFGGRGRIRVTPRDDGQPWTWGSDVVINTNDHYTPQLDVDESTRIEYPGSGWALTIENAEPSHTYTEVSTQITGGHWVATGDPAGWLKLKDVGGGTFSPRTVEFANGSGTSVGISIENHQRWSEMNYIEARRIRADICVDFVPASVTGGSGTESFQGCRILHSQIAANDIGIRTRGNLNYCKFDNCQIFLHGDGAVGIELNGTQYRGCTFNAIKTEEHATDCVSLHTGPDYDGFYGPTFFGGHLMHPATMLTDGGANNPKVFQVKTESNQLQFRCHEPNKTGKASFWYDIGDGWMTLNTGALSGGPDGNDLRITDLRWSQYVPQDVTTISSPSQGTVAYHDPSISADGNTEGPAFYNGTNWVSQVDGTTIS